MVVVEKIKGRDRWRRSIRQVSTTTDTSSLFFLSFSHSQFTTDACAINKTCIVFLTRVAFSPLLSSPFIVSPSLRFSLYSHSHCLMETLQDEPIERFDSEFVSTTSASAISSLLTADDLRNFNSSRDISSITSASGEIPVVVANEILLTPSLLHRVASNDENAEPAVPAVAREKCIGRNNKGVS